MNEKLIDLQVYLDRVRQAKASAQAFPLPENDELKAIYEIACRISEKRFDDAQKICKVLPSDWQREIRVFFSKEFLAEWQKEWTGHGINRTFRFWSASEKVDYLRFTARVLGVLRMRYDAAMGYGSVLSIVRDRDLVPHDDDLDIIVAVATEDVSVFNHELAKMQSYLEDAGFAVRGEYVAHRHVAEGKFMVDVFLGLKTGNYVSLHPGPREALSVEDVFPPKVIKLFDVECLVPRNSEKYLEVVYGQEWRTPLPGWTHDFNPQKYSDWFWPNN